MERLGVFLAGFHAWLLYAPDGTALQYAGTVNVLLSSQMDLHTRVILNLVQHLYVGVYWGARYDL